MTIYLIKRGPRPEHHRAPYHPVLICDRKDMAKWEAGWTGDRAWLWSHHDPKTLGGGWLIERWEGLDIDYGGLVKGGALPDGTHTGFFHKQRDRGYAPRTGDEKPVWLGYDETLQEPWSLLPGAVWWSAKPMPKALQEAGVVYPSDEFTQQRILDKRAQLDDEKAKRGGMYGMARPIPAWWPGVGPSASEVAAGDAMRGFVGGMQDALNDTSSRLVHTEVAGEHYVQVLDDSP